MDKLIEVVRFFAITQIVLIALLIGAVLLTKLVFFIKEKRNRDLRKQIRDLIEKSLDQQIFLNKEELKIIEKNPFETLASILQRDDFTHYSYFPSLKNQLSQEVFKPLAHKLTYSKRWFNRYTATLAYSLGIDEADEEKIIHLAKDKSLLVAMNAATLLVRRPNFRTVNAVIDIFSQGRRIQQSVSSELLMGSQRNITPIVMNRLENEPNIYTRVFCYRLLSKLPRQHIISPQAKKDINTLSIDLKIAAMNYIHHTLDKSKDELIYALAKDPHWEVRATAAKLLSTQKSNKSLNTLIDLFNDSQWWVCLNAAHALKNQGDEGLAILKNQAPDENKFSFEIAQDVIRHIERQNQKPQHTRG